MNFFQKTLNTILKSAFIFIFSCLLTFLNTHTLSASETVFHQFSTEDSGNRLDLKEFLYLSISVELLKYGLSSTKSVKGSDYTLKIDYQQEGNDVQIDLALIEGRKSLGTATIESSIDSTFRNKIGDGVNRLITDSQIGESTVRRKNEATIGDVIDLEDSRPYVSSGGYLRENNSFGIEVGLAPGAQFYLGEFSDYVSWGLNGRISLSFIWLREKQIFGLALTAWGSRGFNGEFAEGGPLYLSSAGGKFMWGLRTGAAQFIAVYGEGGVAPLFLIGQDKEVLVQTCPYFEAGLDFRVVKVLNFYIDLSLAYRAILEKDLMISSIEPSVSFNFEL